MERLGRLPRNGEEDFVCQLHKAISGLKQASRCWHKEINEFLTEDHGLNMNAGDECLNTRSWNRIIMMIVLYVDSSLTESNNSISLSKIKTNFGKAFIMTDLDEAGLCLGFEVSRELKSSSLLLLQNRSTKAMLTGFGREAAKGTYTPMECCSDFSCPDEVKQMYHIVRSLVVWCIYWLVLVGTPELLLGAWPSSLRILKCCTGKQWNDWCAPCEHEKLRPTLQISWKHRNNWICWFRLCWWPFLQKVNEWYASPMGGAALSLLGFRDCKRLLRCRQLKRSMSV